MSKIEKLRVYRYVFENELLTKLRPIVIRNEYWCKPGGGIWTSPVDCDFGWEDYCRSEELGFIDYDRMVRIEMELSGEFIVVDSYEDLDKFVWVKPFPIVEMECIDFEALVKEGIDGIYLTENGLYKTKRQYIIGSGGRGSLFRNLYTWDCECVLILNERCIKKWDVLKIKGGVKYGNM